MSENSGQETPKIEALIRALDRVASLDLKGDEARMEKRLGDRINRLEEKIDAALKHMNEVSVLDNKIKTIEEKARHCEAVSLEHSKTIEALKTWRSIVSAILAVFVAPVCLMALTYLIQHGGK
jgi:hypothetical protein